MGNKANKTLMAIIIILIVVLLVTSCTSLFWGKIGNPFNNSSEHKIEKDKDNIKEVRDNELKFIVPEGETYVGSVYRIEFITEKINPDKFTCTTSDANIAVCIVKENYVEVYAIKEGEVTINVIAETNGKRYIGTHKLTIKDKNKPVSVGVIFTKSNNIIYLSENTTIKLPYKLIKIDGTLSVLSSDPSIATAEIINNEVVVKALKEGKVKITLIVTSNGKKYQATTYVTIKKERNSTNGGTTTPDNSTEVNGNNYYLNTAVNNYNLNHTSSSKDNTTKKILETNLFNNNDIKIQKINGGIHLYNALGYIDIVSSNPNILEIGYTPKDNEKIENYITYFVTTKGSGNATITISGRLLNISGNINNTLLETKNISVNIVDKYYVTLNAMDGTYANGLKEYSFLLSSDEELNLSEYIPVKEADKENCLYYTLDSYNTSSLGTGTRYSKDSKFNAISDTILYAIYSSTVSKEEVTKKGTAYLTDVDIFHNEEYVDKYGKDKVIYPGAKGSHVMTIENTLDSEIKINKINLEEETICQGDKGCLNMGYIIKYSGVKDNNYTYYYGSSNTYQTFNEDTTINKINDTRREKNIDFGISLQPNEKIEISLLWKWLDNDELDTAIGSLGDNNYSIIVSLDYEIIESVCK